MIANKYTLVLGASENPSRYGNIATKRLRKGGFKVYAYGRKSGVIDGLPIRTDFPTSEEGIHTVTLYVSAKNQDEYIPMILDLKPKRVIFNPGTENASFQKELEKKGIEADVSCTLVLLARGIY